MKTSSRTVLAAGIASAVIIPSIAFASFKTNHELLEAANIQGRAADVSYEVHVNADTTHVSAWVKGEGESGESKDLKTAKVNLRMTVDVQEGMKKAERVKIQVRVVNGMLYLHIDEAGPMVAMMAGGQMKIGGSEWYAVSLDELSQKTAQKKSLDDEELKQMVYKIVDAVFTMSERKNAKNTVYTLRWNRNAWKDVLAMIKDQAKELPTSYDPSTQVLQKFFRNFNVRLQYIADMNDAFKSMNGIMTYRDRGISANAKMSISVRTAPVTVTIPTNVTPLENMGGSSRLKNSY